MFMYRLAAMPLLRTHRNQRARKRPPTGFSCAERFRLAETAAMSGVPMTPKRIARGHQHPGRECVDWLVYGGPRQRGYPRYDMGLHASPTRRSGIQVINHAKIPNPGLPEGNFGVGTFPLTN